MPFLSVGYRLAPEAIGTMLAEDVFAGLTWLTDHAHELAVDTGRIAAMGDSGGGADVSPIAATARLTDFTRLAPAYIDTADLNIFRDEDIAYAAPGRCRRSR